MTPMTPTGTVLHCMFEFVGVEPCLHRTYLPYINCHLPIVILLTEEWAWLRNTPSRPWHCEGFVACLELSLAWAVLESHEYACVGEAIVQQSELFFVQELCEYFWNRLCPTYLPGHQNECITPAAHARTG